MPGSMAWGKPVPRDLSMWGPYCRTACQVPDPGCHRFVIFNGFHVIAIYCITYFLPLFQYPLGSFFCFFFGPEPQKYAFFPIDFVRAIAYRITP